MDEDLVETDMKRKRNTPMASTLQWCQWQLLDSILPTGGFAHSFGLESAIQAGLVFGPDDLKNYVIELLENTGCLLLRFVYSSTMNPSIEYWQKLKILDATLTNEVGRKASVSQGSSLMRVASTVFTEIPSFKSMRDVSLGSGVVSFHHAPVFGLISGLVGMDSGTSQRDYMFVTMRDVISAATRLNIVGPMGAAVLQHQIAPMAEAMSEKWMDRPLEDASQTAPLLDTIRAAMVTCFLGCSVPNFVPIDSCIKLKIMFDAGMRLSHSCIPLFILSLEIFLACNTPVKC